MSKTLIAGGLGLALAGAALAPVPASAHHSFAMFDETATVTLSGMIVKWGWTNPHAYLVLMADDGQEWDLESVSPSMLARTGLTRNTFKPGDKVTVKAHPRRDKAPGGALMTVQVADGRVVNAGRGAGRAPE
jgi:hypothetical protein